MNDNDPFWNRKSDEIRAAQPWTWPRAFAEVGRRIVFWLAVVVIIYILARYG